MIPLGCPSGHGAGTWGGFRGPAWKAGTWGGFRGPAWWNETFRVTLGNTWGDVGGFRGQGTRGWDMGWV